MYETNKCGICLEKLEKTNICITECGHSFCLKCILKNSKYNYLCPFCRKEIIEKDNIMDALDNNMEEENENNSIIEEIQYNYIGRIDYEEDCYHFPIIIEDISTLAKVINEVTGGLLCTDSGLGWILGILTLINDVEETKFNLIDNINNENEILLAEYSKVIIMEAIFIYKRSQILKKLLQNKLK